MINREYREYLHSKNFSFVNYKDRFGKLRGITNLYNVIAGFIDAKGYAIDIGPGILTENINLKPAIGLQDTRFRKIYLLDIKQSKKIPKHLHF